MGQRYTPAIGQYILSTVWSELMEYSSGIIVWDHGMEPFQQKRETYGVCLFIRSPKNYRKVWKAAKCVKGIAEFQTLSFVNTIYWENTCTKGLTISFAHSSDIFSTDGADTRQALKLGYSLTFIRVSNFILF